MERILEGEHGEGRHQSVAEGNVGIAAAWVRDPLEMSAEQAE
jgi:hypothetical protein